MTEYTRNGETIEMALGDRLISDDGCVAVEATEDGLAPMVFLPFYTRKGDRWLMLHERRADMDQAFASANQAWEIIHEHGGKPDFDIEVNVGGNVVR